MYTKGSKSKRFPNFLMEERRVWKWFFCDTKKKLFKRFRRYSKAFRECILIGQTHENNSFIFFWGGEGWEDFDPRFCVGPPGGKAFRVSFLGVVGGRFASIHSNSHQYYRYYQHFFLIHRYNQKSFVKDAKFFVRLVDFSWNNLKQTNIQVKTFVTNYSRHFNQPMWFYAVFLQLKRNENSKVSLKKV